MTSDPGGDTGPTHGETRVSDDTRTVPPHGPRPSGPHAGGTPPATAAPVEPTGVPWARTGGRVLAPATTPEHAEDPTTRAPAAGVIEPASPARDPRLGALASHLAAANFACVGNVALELLLRPGQDVSPDEASLELDSVMARTVRAYFRIPEGLPYRRPVRDKYLPFGERDTWAARYQEMIVEAHVLGTWVENLPPPHDERRLFYRLAAFEQAAAIRQAHLRWLTAAPAPREPAEYRAWLARQEDVREKLEKDERAARHLRRLSDADRERRAALAKKIRDNAAAGIPGDLTDRAVAKTFGLSPPPPPAPATARMDFRTL